MSEKDLKPASVVNGSSLKSEVMKETQFVSEKLVIAVKMIGFTSENVSVLYPAMHG